MPELNVIAATPKTVDTLRRSADLVTKLDETTSQQQKNIPGPSISLTSVPIIPAKVVSGDGLNGYVCDLYENGLTNPVTGRGIVYLANGNSTIYTLPVNTVLYVQSVPIAIMGSDNE